MEIDPFEVLRHEMGDYSTSLTTETRQTLRRLTNFKRYIAFTQLPERLFREHIADSKGVIDQDYLTVLFAFQLGLILPIPANLLFASTIGPLGNFKESICTTRKIIAYWNKSSNTPAIEAELDREDLLFYDRYLRDIRSLHKGSNGPFLFPGNDFNHRDQAEVSRKIKRITQVNFRCSINWTTLRYIQAFALLAQDANADAIASQFIGQTRNQSIEPLKLFVDQLRYDGMLASWPQIIR